jgi:hypothetical protein
MAKVLVLCQRKSGMAPQGDYDVKDVVIPPLQEYVSTLIDSPEFEYMSLGVGEENPDVDYKMALGENDESEAFQRGHEDGFHAIVLQSCPIAYYMAPSFPYMYHLLKRQGRIIITIFNQKNKRIVDLIKDATLDHDFANEFFRYFSVVSPGVYQKRDEILTLEMSKEEIERLKHSGKRKKTKRRGLKWTHKSKRNRRA